MSEQSEPTEPQTTRRRRRWPWIVLGVGVVAVLVGGLLGGGAWLAHDYEKDFDHWNEFDKPKVATGADVPVTAFASAYEEQDIKDHQAGCDDLRHQRQQVSKAARDLPRITELPIRWVSPSYRKAVSRDDRRVEAVRAYARSADRVLAQTVRDCQWLTKPLEISIRLDKVLSKVEKFVDPKGTQGGYVCEEKEGCVPSSSKRLRSFADQLDKARAEVSSLAELYRSDACAETSYGKACGVIASSYQEFLTANSQYIKAVRHSTLANGAAVDATAGRAEKALKKLERTVRRVLLQQFPDLKKWSAFKDDPGAPEAYLGGVAFIRTRDLTNQESKLLDRL